MAQAEKANQRIDLMDVRCDGIEDRVSDLKDHILRKDKEFEDMQLEAQINQLKRDLADAKTGLNITSFEFQSIKYTSEINE